MKTQKAYSAVLFVLTIGFGLQALAGTRPLLSSELIDNTPVRFQDTGKRLQKLEQKFPRLEFSMSFDPVFEPSGYRFYSGFFRDMTVNRNEITAPFVYNKMDIRFDEAKSTLLFDRRTQLLRLRLVIGSGAKPALEQVVIEKCVDIDAITEHKINVTRSRLTRKELESKMPGKFKLLGLYSKHGKEGMTRNPTLMIEEAMGFPLSAQEKAISKDYSDWYLPLWLSIVEGQQTFNDNCRNYQTVDSF